MLQEARTIVLCTKAPVRRILTKPSFFTLHRTIPNANSPRAEAWRSRLDIGHQAYGVVKQFSQFGTHRTGTQGDRDTLHWLGSKFASDGADVSFQTFPYNHFEFELTVESAGKVIDADVLYYSFTGQRNLRNPAIDVVDAHADEAEISSDIYGMVAAAKAEGKDGLILATQSPSGGLCGINRAYGTDLEFPVILVAQEDLDTIQSNGADASIAASVRNSTAQNLIARFPGPTGARRIVVTTPISGWFRCAGERGCGLAVAMFVSEQLSKRFAVDLLLASGHELGFLGGYHLAEHYDVQPDCVLHIGSCIANFEAEMTSICSASDATTERIASELHGIGITPSVPANAVDANNWVGESMCWASKSWPMLSVAGTAPHFHAHSDLPDAVTSPDLIAKAIDAILAATLALARYEKTEGQKRSLL